MSTALIEFTQVGKTYKRGKMDVPVLSNLDLVIEDGDFLALMGPSGSGKTTLLNLLGGLDHPTAGSITISEQCITKMSARALARWRSQEVGFVFQFYNLLPVLTAKKNVELPLLLTRFSAAQRRYRAESALEIVGLADRGGHRPHELSGSLSASTLTRWFLLISNPITTDWSGEVSYSLTCGWEVRAVLRQ